MQQRICICPTAVIFDKSAHPSDALRVLIILLLGLLRPTDQNTRNALGSDMTMTMTNALTAMTIGRPREEKTTR